MGQTVPELIEIILIHFLEPFDSGGIKIRLK